MSIKNLISTNMTKETQLMSDEEKIRYLLSNPHLLASYGSDAASTFVNTLRDDGLDPAIRQERIADQREDLVQIVADLKNAREKTTDEKIIKDIDFNKENIEALLSMSKTLAEIDVTNRITDAIEGVIDVVNEPNSRLVLVSDEMRDPYAIRGSDNEHLATVVWNQDKSDRAAKISQTLAVVFTMIMIASAIMAPLLITIILSIILMIAGASASKMLATTSTEKISLDQGKFKAFVSKCSSYSYAKVRKYMGPGEDFSSTSTEIHNKALEEWVVKAGPVFDVMTTSDIENYTKATRGEKYRSNEYLALDKLAISFDKALLTNNEIYLSEQRAKAEKARRDAIKKMEADKRLKNFTDTRQRVLENFIKNEPSA